MIVVIRQFTVLAVTVVLKVDAGGDSVGSSSSSSSSGSSSSSSK